MSIYKKTDMKEMPTGCAYCNFFVWRGCAIAQSLLKTKGIMPLYRLKNCPLIDINEETQFSQIVNEMAESQITKKTLKIHTEKQIAEFEIKLVSMEFKEKKDV